MDVRLIAVPYDSALRGWRMGAGPLHLLGLGLAAELESRLGVRATAQDLEVPDDPPPAEIRTAFELDRLLAAAVAEARAAGALPLVLTGNCQTAIGTIAGLDGCEVAVAWFDAHADFNTPDTTRSGFLDGTALAAVAGHCWNQLALSVPGFRPVPEERVLLCGARDLDPLEESRLARSGVQHLRPADLPSRLEPAARTAAAGAEGFYLHLDLDVLDPAEGRINPFPAPGGLSVADLLAAVDLLAGTAPLLAVTLSAYAPSFDEDGRGARAAIEIATAAVACEARRRGEA